MVLAELWSIRATLATVAENVRHHGADIAEVRADADELGRRLRGLERWRYTVVGAAAAAAIAFAPALEAIVR